MRWGFYMDKSSMYAHLARPPESHPTLSMRLIRACSVLPLVWYHPEGCEELKLWVASLSSKCPIPTVPVDEDLVDFELFPSSANDMAVEHLMFGLH